MKHNQSDLLRMTWKHSPAVYQLAGIADLDAPNNFAHCFEEFFNTFDISNKLGIYTNLHEFASQFKLIFFFLELERDNQYSLEQIIIRKILTFLSIANSTVCQIIFNLIIFNLLKAFLIDHLTTENEPNFRKQILMKETCIHL